MDPVSGAMLGQVLGSAVGGFAKSITDVFVSRQKTSMRIDDLTKRMESLASEAARANRSAAEAHQRAQVLEILLAHLVQTGAFQRQGNVLSAVDSAPQGATQAAIAETVRWASSEVIAITAQNAPPPEDRHDATTTGPDVPSPAVGVGAGRQDEPSLRARAAEIYLGGLDAELESRRRGEGDRR